MDTLPRQALTPTLATSSAAGHTSHQRFWRRHCHLIVVIAVAFAIRLCFGLATADTYDYDEFVLLLLGRDFAHGAVPYRDFMFFHPPGELVLLRLLEPLTSAWWPIARLVMMAIDTATAGLVWYVGTLLYDRRSAFVAGLLYAFNPVALISAVRVGQDPVLTFLGVAGLAILLSKRSHTAAALAGASLGLAIWFKYPAAVLLPVYVLAAPRRSPAIILGAGAALAAVFAPFLPYAHQLYDQTVTFQRTRWLMPLDQRIGTTLIFWLGLNALAVAAMVRQRPHRPWLLAGFALGGVFVLSSQVYYHYFVPAVPFAALIAAPFVARFARSAFLALAGFLIAAVIAWAALIDLGGSAPAYVTAAHLSSIQPTIQVLRASTDPGDYVLADRYEYSYLANRQALAHYFWNVGVLKDATYLELRLPAAAAVILSYGASSGYPSGFVGYLDHHYPSIRTRANTIWLLPRRRVISASSTTDDQSMHKTPQRHALGQMVGARGFEPPTSASRTLRATKLRHAPKNPPDWNYSLSEPRIVARSAMSGQRNEATHRAVHSSRPHSSSNQRFLAFSASLSSGVRSNCCSASSGRLTKRLR